jgi:hypothetical protein
MNKDQILARELAKVGAIGGGVGGAVGGGVLTAAAGALGGASGAWIASRFLPTESYASDYLLPCNASRALTIIVNVLAELGQLQDGSEINSPNPTLTAVIGSGFMRMNPCLLVIEIVSHSDKETAAVIRGAAKEGLIKQHTAEKAVTRVIDAIKTEVSRIS